MAGIYLSDPERVYTYDTTLRDGAQTEGVSFSTEDKLEILTRLDEFGIDFIEGGWPGSNPKDVLFFERAGQVKLRSARLVAFGRTRRANIAPEEDDNLGRLLEAGTGWVCIFGKSSVLQVEQALRVPLRENLAMIEESVSFLRGGSRKVVFDAEHFFDGWKENREYALEVLRRAERGGASVIVLCDTNGGSMPDEIGRIVGQVREAVDVPIGVHAHNDGEMAVANSLMAVEAGALMVQGTINGLGERCGNANLCSVIPALRLKMGRQVGDVDLRQLTALSHFVGEVANVAPDSRLPYVGRSAFAHKGGIHVSAVARDTRTYEHIDPAVVGNERRILVSELSGSATVATKLRELGIEESDGKQIIERLKQLEAEGFQFEGAEASFQLLVRRLRGEHVPRFTIDGFRVFVDVSGDSVKADASIKVIDSSGMIEHTAADGNGPVNALDRALRKALERFYPQLKGVRLTDYKVRVIDAKDATAAKVRVLIRSTDGKDSWTTVGVSTNIIEASLMALVDSMDYVLINDGG